VCVSLEPCRNPKHIVNCVPNSCLQLDLERFQWREILPEGPKPVGRSYHTMFQFQHLTFIFGGASFSGPDFEYTLSNASCPSSCATVYGDFWVYDPTIGMNGVWKNLGSLATHPGSGMPSPRHSASTGFQNGVAYVFGGNTGYGTTSEMYKYIPDEFDATQGVWAAVTQTGSRLGPPGTVRER